MMRVMIRNTSLKFGVNPTRNKEVIAKKYFSKESSKFKGEIILKILLIEL